MIVKFIMRACGQANISKQIWRCREVRRACYGYPGAIRLERRDVSVFCLSAVPGSEQRGPTSAAGVAVAIAGIKVLRHLRCITL
jgi:hypothetical protein